jgi:outer membrane receptor for Fe3+-dicitrate
VTPRLWIAAGAQYNSGLPAEVDRSSDLAFLVRQYGQAIVDFVDFESGRIRPSWTADASLGWELWNRDRRSFRLQTDVFNVFDRLNVINFAGLLSGTAIAPRRTWALRAQLGF